MPCIVPYVFDPNLSIVLIHIESRKERNRGRKRESVDVCVCMSERADDRLSVVTNAFFSSLPRGFIFYLAIGRRNGLARG